MATAKVNLNDYIYFKLNNKGRKILQEYYSSIRGLNNYKPELNPTKMQLWQFMQIFGKHFQIGFDTILESLDIEIENLENEYE